MNIKENYVQDIYLKEIYRNTRLIETQERIIKNLIKQNSQPNKTNLCQNTQEIDKLMRELNKSFLEFSTKYWATKNKVCGIEKMDE